MIRLGLEAGFQPAIFYEMRNYKKENNRERQDEQNKK